MTACHNAGCPGELQERRILRLVNRKDDPIVVANVPAEVCSFCGETLFTPETVRRLEAIQGDPPRPARMIPLYEFAPEMGEEQGVMAAERAPAHAD